MKNRVICLLCAIGVTFFSIFLVTPKLVTKKQINNLLERLSVIEIDE